MRLLSSFGLLGIVLASSETQKTLPAHEHQSASPLDSSFDQKVEWALEHFNIPGLAVAVSHGETYSKGYGVSDILTSRPVTEHTLFFTGSTTKAFVSAAISLLVDDDIKFPAVHWDTPVHTLLPTDFVLNDPWATSQMTIIDILSHRSGLPRHDWVWLANITLQEAIKSMRYLPFTASPRSEWQYCNLMYGVAAHLIETLTNQSVESFLRDRIWSPLNMTETYLSLDEAQSAQRDISQGYYLNQDGNITSTDRVSIETLRGAGNTLSSVSDYAKWISTMLNRGPPFSQSGYATLLGSHAIVSRNPIEPFQTPTLYGLGWMLDSYNGEVIVSHGGAQFGYGACVVLLPRRNFGLVLLGNNMNGVDAAANVLAYHLIDEELGISPESRFDWVARGDAVINNTRLSEGFLFELYPKIPCPPLPSPLNFSFFEGSYSHLAYPDLILTSNCTGDDRNYTGLNRTTPDLCASFANSNEYSKDMVIDLFHISGTQWLQIAVGWGVPSATRVEFMIRDGSARWLGIEIEPLMAERKEKILWKHML
ncbi:hypothetical protein PMG11_09389 [Penicillium brasilianum]|uniref:Beta-lactamase-related domain-containing protein n=1 Tax=Penicillium brasilianum TaxID=104259 RepID=A0A0F7U0L5_PENBI|nr:hypothetical protein PMG11_09389 [Penicillium brasilianum]